MLELGIKAPDFELPDQNGEVHKLSDYLGKKIILYFYPKDNTPGCTKQACGFFPDSYTLKGALQILLSQISFPLRTVRRSTWASSLCGDCVTMSSSAAPGFRTMSRIGSAAS